MESFLTTALCGFARLSADLELRHANGTLGAWLGYEPGELTQMPLHRLLDSSSLERLREDIIPRVQKQAHTHAEPVMEGLTLRTRDGEPVPVLASFTASSAASATGASSLAPAEPMICQAVFLRMPAGQSTTSFPSPAAEREAAPLSEDKVKTLSRLSHELRSPLQSISLTTYVLLDEDPGPINEEQRADLLRIQRAAQDVSRLVNEILSQVRVGK